MVEGNSITDLPEVITSEDSTFKVLSSSTSEEYKPNVMNTDSIINNYSVGSKKEENTNSETATERDEINKDSDESEETEEYEEDSEEEEYPPILKYTRITSKLPKSFFNRDSISSCKFTDDVFLFGTHSGILHITTTDFKPLQILKCHRSSILSIYCDNINFATASMDGTVIIGSLDNPSQLTAFDFKRPVHSIILDDDYKTSQKFISGGMAGEIILSQRNWLGNRSDITLSKGKGSILGIYKLGNIIFWFNDDGITFVDSITKSKLLNIEYPQAINKSDNNWDSDISRPDLFIPHVDFPESDRIMIGWGCNVWSLKVSLNQKSSQDFTHIGSILSSAASSLRGIPDCQVELEHYFTVEMIIAGICSFKDDQIICIGYEKWKNNNHELQLKSGIPELRIFDIISSEEINNDEIIVKNYKKLSINDYILSSFISNDSAPRYYLITATDCICIQELSLTDHFEWFLKYNKLLKAWDIAQYIPTIGFKERLDIGINYLLQEIELNKWETLGSNMSKIFMTAENNINKNNNETNTSHKDFIKEQWQTLIFKALNSKQINSDLIDNIPQDYNFDILIFDTILDFLLSNKDFKEFSRLLHLWDITTFSTNNLEEKLEKLVKETSNNTEAKVYRDQLIYLYLKTNKFSKAIKHMLLQKDKRAIDLLLEHPQLIPEFIDSFIDIILLAYGDDSSNIPFLTRDTIQRMFQKPIKLAVIASKYVPLDDMILLFKNQDTANLNKILLIIMETLLEEDPRIMSSHENEMIELYIICEKTKLLPFLKERRNYDIAKAIELCKSTEGLYNELIYLWGRIGEAKKALRIIVDELDDPQMAIDYVISWKDEELWDFMITYTIDKPEYIRLLLKYSDILGERYNSVIVGIADTLSISDIKMAIDETLNSKALSLEVFHNILQLVNDDSLHVAKEYLKLSAKGRYFDIEEDP